MNNIFVFSFNILLNYYFCNMSFQVNKNKARVGMTRNMNLNKN